MGREARPKQVIVYADKNGKEPFTDWLDGLQDTVVRRRILTRLSRLVVLLCGGDKDTQVQDIKTAKILWKEYLIDAKLQNIQ